MARWLPAQQNRKVVGAGGAQLAAAERELEALAAARDALAREAEGLRADNQGLQGKAAQLQSLTLEAGALRQQVRGRRLRKPQDHPCMMHTASGRWQC